MLYCTKDTKARHIMRMGTDGLPYPILSKELSVRLALAKGKEGPAGRGHGQCSALWFL